MAWWEFVLGGLLLLFIAAIARAVRTMSKLPRLEDTAARTGPWLTSGVASPSINRQSARSNALWPRVSLPWPRVSVIVAACNEEATIDEAARSILAMGYPNLQLVLVDDRSTDRTGALIDVLADRFENAIAVHIETLPAGWLGKLNAMQAGVNVADGDWLLFTDADVHFAHGTVQRAVDMCQREGLGHLTLMPRLRTGAIWLDALQAAFAVLFIMVVRPDKLGDPNADVYVGVGAFNLVRRVDFERTEGLQWLRMEVLDDAGIALMMIRQARVKSCVATAGESLSIRWYGTVGEMVRGLGKNGFIGLANGRVWQAVLQVVLCPIVALTIVVAAVAGGVWLKVLCALFTVGMAMIASRLERRVGHPILATMLSPFMLLVLGFAIMRSTWQTVRGGGVTWRGTFYSLQELRAGKRVVI